MSSIIFCNSEPNYCNSRGGRNLVVSHYPDHHSERSEEFRFRIGRFSSIWRFLGSVSRILHFTEGYEERKLDDIVINKIAVEL